MDGERLPMGWPSDPLCIMPRMSANDEPLPAATAAIDEKSVFCLSSQDRKPVTLAYSQGSISAMACRGSALLLSRWLAFSLALSERSTLPPLPLLLCDLLLLKLNDEVARGRC